MNKEKLIKYINRELSWLEFNGRVLQEAADVTVPLLERIKFLGIFSNNMDEFFRVRVASQKRASEVNKEVKNRLGFSPKKILKQIHKKVLQQQKQFEQIYGQILEDLASRKVFIINEKQLTENQGRKVKEYFHREVRTQLVPLMIDTLPDFPPIKDGSIYLAVRLTDKDKSRPVCFSLIEVPTTKLSRFFVFERSNNRTYVILLDDVIRYCLEDIFAIFGYDDCEAYTVKITKDAGIDLDDDVSKSFLELMSIGVRRRKHGKFVRFIHDEEIDPDLLAFLVKRLDINEEDNIIPAGRYHNFKNFMRFPKFGASELSYAKLRPLLHVDIDPNKSLFKLLKRKDIMLHVPYQSYSPVIDFLREAAIDPKVLYIKITLYRLAKRSDIINALINAKMNGKDVTVVLELQARFDEEANIAWAEKLQEFGVRVVHGPKQLKIHAKLCLIGRLEKKDKIVQYVNIATGNFNEDTAKIYSDFCLFTTHKGIVKDANKVFSLIQNSHKQHIFKHLLVSPQYLKPELLDLINREIHSALAGEEAYIIAKMNSLNDEAMIDHLYAASQAGVKIQLIIRGICSLIPGVEGLSENIEVISIVDKYLEHARVYIFANQGEEKCFISSADWMERNLHRRIEVACPIYDEEIKAELKNLLSIQLRDNTKARLINLEDKSNTYKRDDKPPCRSQDVTYTYFSEKRKETEDDMIM